MTLSDHAGRYQRLQRCRVFAKARSSEEAVNRRSMLSVLTLGTAFVPGFASADTEAAAAPNDELMRMRSNLEEGARGGYEGTLCATPYGIDIVGITEFIAIIGALVGGLAARQRQQQIRGLNEQLRKANAQLRQQARSIAAPSRSPPRPPPQPSLPAAAQPPLPTLSASAPLDTAVVSIPSGNGNGSSVATVVPAAPQRGATAQQDATAGATASVSTAAAPAVPAAGTDMSAQWMLMSMDDEQLSPQMRPLHELCRNALREGKRLLREKQGAAAMVRFEKGMMLSRATKDKVLERRAVRGLAAAARLQKQLPTAIKHLKQVLELSKQMGEHTGDADAYGTIADVFTEMGDFERAAKYYDKYIAAMANEGVV